jgi:O-methyltransferase
MTCSNIAQFLYFERFFEHIRDVEGDIVECGVGRGDTFVMLSILAKREGIGRRVWGFDSFEGFPPPTAEDRSPRNPQAGEWKSDLGLVVQRLRAAGLDEHFVNRQGTLIPGFFEESLELFRGKQIALLHLDCDLYRSYQTCLATLYPLVQPNGIVAFDEYINTGQLRSFPGAQRAIDEYFGDQVHLITSDRDTGQYYLVKPE